MNCRHCGTPLTHTFLDLGFAPPSNAYLTEEDMSKPEKYYPLKIKVCDNCRLALETAKARVALGVEPKWDLAETVTRSMNWYRAQHEGEDARELCEAEIAEVMEK